MCEVDAHYFLQPLKIVLITQRSNPVFHVGGGVLKSATWHRRIHRERVQITCTFSIATLLVRTIRIQTPWKLSSGHQQSSNQAILRKKRGNN